MSTLTDIQFIQLGLAFNKILDDPRYVEGITYGKPRKGHDEGSVKNHIWEMEGTLNRIAPMLTAEEILKLQILIHVHDTFKMEGKRQSNNKQVSLQDPRSHCSLAKSFLAEFISDEAMLAIAQFHDEGHALWQQAEAKGRYSMLRLSDTLHQIPDLELYLIFTVIDGWTVSKLKDRTPKWFLDEVTLFRQPEKPYRAYQALQILETVPE